MTTDGQVRMLYRQPFADAVKPLGCLFQSRRALMGYQLQTNGSLGSTCVLYQFMSHIEGTALLFESEWFL